MDEIDRANDHAMNLNDDALAFVRGQVPEEKHEEELTEDDLTCDICEEPNSIPRARALRGYTSCVSCAQWSEKTNRRTKVHRGHNGEYED